MITNASAIPNGLSFSACQQAIVCKDQRHKTLFHPQVNNLLRTAFEITPKRIQIPFFTILLLFGFTAKAQVQTQIVGDSVRVHGNIGTSELILENSTKNVDGFLYNKGNGRTEFRKIMTKVNDSLYIINGDTLRVTANGISGNNAILNQYTKKQDGNYWIDTAKSLRFLLADTLGNPTLDMNGSAGTVIRWNDRYPYKGLLSSTDNYNYNGPAFSFSSRADSGNRFPRNEVAFFSKGIIGNIGQTAWGDNILWPSRPAIESNTTYLLKYLPSKTITFGGNKDAMNAATMSCYNIGMQSIGNDTGVIQTGWGQGAAINTFLRFDCWPRSVENVKHKGQYVNSLSYLDFRSKPGSYLESFVDYYAGSENNYGSGGRIGQKINFYAANDQYGYTDRSYGFYQEGTAKLNFFAGQILIGDSSLTNCGSNRLYVDGNVKFNSLNDGSGTTKMVTATNGVLGIQAVPINGNSSNYTLPIATNSVLGAVKIGNGLSITGDGTLSTITGSDYVQNQFSTYQTANAKFQGNLDVFGNATFGGATGRFSFDNSAYHGNLTMNVTGTADGFLYIKTNSGYIINTAPATKNPVFQLEGDSAANAELRSFNLQRGSSAPNLPFNIYSTGWGNEGIGDVVKAGDINITSGLNAYTKLPLVNGTYSINLASTATGKIGFKNGTTEYLKIDGGKIIASLPNNTANSNSADKSVFIDSNNQLYSKSISTTFTEADPVFNVSAAKNITGTNITNWNTAYSWGNHAAAGYLTGLAAASIYQPAGSYVTTAGRETITGIKTFGGSDTAVAGTSRGLTINPTVVAAANSDFLIGVDVAPVFNTNSRTSVSTYAMRLNENLLFPNGFGVNVTQTDGIRRTAVVMDVNNNIVFGSTSTGSSIQGGRVDLNYRSSHMRWFNQNTQVAQMFATTGDLVLQNGGTFIDSNYRLDIKGDFRTTGINRFQTLSGTGTRLMVVNNKGEASAVKLGANLSFANDTLNSSGAAEADPTVATVIKNIPSTSDPSATKYLNWNGTAYVRKQIDYSEIANPPVITSYTLPAATTTGLGGVIAGTGLSVAGDGTLSVTNNNTQLSGSATLDFPSTTASSSSDLTLTVTGAADGDVVSLGVPNGATLAKTCYTAWVSAANTVTIRFNNYSTAAANPASGTFKVKVLK